MKSPIILLAILALLTWGILLSQATDAYVFDDEAMEWALGEGWEALPLYAIDDVWNERHGNIWFCSGTLVPEEAFDIMADIYYGRYEKVGDLIPCPESAYDLGTAIYRRIPKE